MTLVIAGQSGAGKSTLVQNLLHLEDNDANAPLAGQSPDSVTKEVKPFHGNINGVMIAIVDMPDLAGASDNEEKKIIAELIKVTEGRADMLLYCVNMGPSGRIGNSDRKIVKMLTSVFTPEIWERAILVLTFGDDVKERNRKRGTTAMTPTVEAAMNSYAKAFERILLANSTAQMKVIPVLKDEDSESRPAEEIAAVVAGEMPDEEILPGVKWNACIYKEVLKKCECDAIPSILKIIIPESEYAQDGTILGTIGGIVGVAAVGAVTGAHIGAFPGAIGGAVITGVGVGMSAIFYQLARNRYLESKGKRAQLLKEIEELRIKDETNDEVQQESKKDK